MKANEKNELCYPVKKVQFRTCVELYSKWKVTRLRYKTASSNGIEVEVEYADTLDLIQPNVESNFSINTKINEYNDLENIKCFPLNIEIGSNQRYKPLTALCLHGAPGCHKDYQHLIKYFIKRNVRVIAPKFPNYGLTKKTPFCHSPAEKSEYIKDFLQAINVDRVDLLLCHSSGLFVAARLINDSLNAFGIHIENVICKKCKKDKKCSKCSKKQQAEEQEKNENKDVDLFDSTSEDEEEEEVFKKFSDKVEDLKKMSEFDEKIKQKFEQQSVSKEKNKENGKENNKEKSKEKSKELKEKNKDQNKELTDQKRKDLESLEEKTDEKSDESSVKPDEKQVSLLTEDEGFIEEQVKGQQKEARRLFSFSTVQKSKIYFGSLILINVVSHKRSKLLNPVLQKSLYEPSAMLYQLKISRSVLRFCGKIYLDVVGSPVDYSNFDNTILTLTTVLRSNVKSLRQQLQRISKTNLPILMFFSENDRLISKNTSYELANFLNVNYITRDFSEPSHHNYDVFNYNAKKKPDKKGTVVEENNNNTNEVNNEIPIEAQSTTSSDEYDSLRHNESESDTSSTKNSSSNEDNASFKSNKTSDSESQRTKELEEPIVSNPVILNQVKYPYAVSIKKGRHYSHITHSHVMDEHIGKLISIINLRKD